MNKLHRERAMHYWPPTPTHCSALEDANTALKLDSHWAKGYYRKGRALAGLKVSDGEENVSTMDPV